MSAPVLVWPDMKATVVALKESITGKPFFCLKVDGVADRPVYLEMGPRSMDALVHPESMFNELALRINKGGR
jgi:hypothetical protein